MDADEILKQSAQAKSISTQATQTEAQTEQARPYNSTVSEFAWLWGSMSFLIAWVALFLMLSKVWTTAQDRVSVSISHIHKVPCRDCRFFSSNPHLKCAVHPAIALKKEAANCPDYWPRDGKFPR